MAHIKSKCVRVMGLTAAAVAATTSVFGLKRSAPSAMLAQPATVTGTEWHNVNGDTNETGFSPLHQITSVNARQLGVAWSLDLPDEASLEAAPVIANGVVYFTGAY